MVLGEASFHVVSACKERSGRQAITALKRCFSCNDSQQHTIDRIIDDLRVLKLGESVTAHDHINKFMELIESLSILGEEIPPQTNRNFLLNTII